MTKDIKWIEVLSGRRKPNKKNHDELEAFQLREAIHNYEKDIGLNKITAENSYFRFEKVRDLKKSKTVEQEKDKLHSRLLAYFKNKLQAIRLIFVFILGVCASLLLPLMTINAPMQVANNEYSTNSPSGIEQASKENKKDLSAISELKNINPKINLLTSHISISVNDYIELNKIHSRESEDYLNKYIVLAFNNFLDYGDLLKSKHVKPLLCLPQGKTYKADKLREFIDLEVNDNNKIDLNQRIEIVLLFRLAKENPCN
jgi:hypothetical protein